MIRVVYCAVCGMSGFPLPHAMRRAGNRRGKPSYICVDPEDCIYRLAIRMSHALHALEETKRFATALDAE